MDKVDKVEQAGDIVGKVHGETTIRARVFDKHGKLLEDLGVIAGKRTKAEGARTNAALKRLADNYEGRKDGGR